MESTPGKTLRARREAVVREHIDAENSGNLDAMIASFHRPRYDVVPIGAVSEGEAAVRELVAGLVNAFGDFHFKPLRTHHSEQAVIVEARMSGNHRASWAGMEPRGGRMDIRLACVFDFDGDRSGERDGVF
jgi:SnoaL-like domain